MKVALTVAQMLIRITGVLLLILGLLIWTEGAQNLVNIHIGLGIVLVLSVWIFSVAAARAGAPIGLTVSLAVVGLIVLGLGMSQRDLLPGTNHWIIQVVHLLVGVTAISLAEVLGGRLRRDRLATATA